MQSKTISELLLDLGIEHKKGDDRGRYLYKDGVCLGVFDAKQAVQLIKKLSFKSRA